MLLINTEVLWVSNWTDQFWKRLSEFLVEAVANGL